MKNDYDFSAVLIWNELMTFCEINSWGYTISNTDYFFNLQVHNREAKVWSFLQIQKDNNQISYVINVEDAVEENNIKGFNVVDMAFINIDSVHDAKVLIIELVGKNK